MNNSIIENEDFLKRTRNIRNQLLKKTDKKSIDFSMVYEQQSIIKAYRQDLRDFIKNNERKISAGKKVDFPTQPYFIDLIIISIKNIKILIHR
jgi:hypothetical protein